MSKPRRRCPECYLPSAHKSRFCCPEHQRAFNNRQACEGKAAIALAKAWALGRGGGNTAPNPISRVAMRELTAMLKDLNDADKAAGRMPATEYVELLMANESRYFDRRRS